MRIELVPWYDPSGEIGGVMTFGFDITDQLNARAQKDILLAELEHRVKNTLAIVQAIVRSSARTARSKKQLEEALLGRLGAVSRTHEALTASNWEGQKLQDLIESALTPFLDPANGRFRYEGPDLTLDPKVALTLGLAFHELATNAAKYGALTGPEGRIAVEAQAGNGALTRLEWRETGGPAVQPPEAEGFATFLLQRIVGAELGARVAVDYGTDGLRYVIETTETGEPA
jgi:two-component sensor histidine kinase